MRDQSIAKEKEGHANLITSPILYVPALIRYTKILKMPKKCT
jgi:hypothetical protein